MKAGVVCLPKWLFVVVSIQCAPSGVQVLIHQSHLLVVRLSLVTRASLITVLLSFVTISIVPNTSTLQVIPQAQGETGGLTLSAVAEGRDIRAIRI